jgi:hypothetical protein
MKISYFLLAMVMAGSTELYAQTNGSGLYMTAQDYAGGRLSYQQQAGQKHRVRADIPFQHGLVKVVQGGQVHRFVKNDVYGYRDEKGRNFRFASNKAYRILDDTRFPLYSVVENITKGKEKTRELKYYFSAQAGSDIQPLTKQNLKRAFPDNRRFHDLLDLQFRHDRELAAYDTFRKEYKLKAVFDRASGESKGLVRQ